MLKTHFGFLAPFLCHPSHAVSPNHAGRSAVPRRFIGTHCLPITGMPSAAMQFYRSKVHARCRAAAFSAQIPCTLPCRCVSPNHAGRSAVPRRFIGTRIRNAIRSAAPADFASLRAKRDDPTKTAALKRSCTGTIHNSVTDLSEKDLLFHTISDIISML